MIDTNSEFGSRVLRRLQEEQIIWLVTVDAAHTPQPSPVWFHWDGENLLIYSKPNTPKLRNIANNTNVALHFDTDQEGDNVVILLGQARLAGEVTDERVRIYLGKYDHGITNLNMTPETFIQTYNTPLLVTPTKVRGY